MQAESGCTHVDESRFAGSRLIGFFAPVRSGGEVVAAVERSAAGYYDLVLMDVMMPNVDGYEATRRIRALTDKHLASVPIIEVTADAFDEVRRAVLDAGMNRHISKPGAVPELSRAISELLGSDSRLRHGKENE